MEDPCSPEETRAYRRELQEIGQAEFLRKTIGSGAVSVKKLLAAFGYPARMLEGAFGDAPARAYNRFLSVVLTREISRRVKLPEYNTVDDAVQLLKKSKNIIVLTGAGISTSLGVPDFRSEGGLYSRIKQDFGLEDPQEVFNIELFREDPTIFYRVAKDLLPSTDSFSPTHAFIYFLQQNGLLLTNYTQNIDNIELKAGILPEKLIQCHGSFGTASCIKCGHRVQGDSIFPQIRAEEIPRCALCLQTLCAAKGSAGMKRKRSNNREPRKRSRNYDHDSDSTDEDDNIVEAGIMKPDIIFFGEALPDEFRHRLMKHDKDLVDLVIVIGTSLKVAPVSDVIPYLSMDIPQIYINLNPVTHFQFDIELLGSCDVVVAELCRRAGWDLQHSMIPDGQQVDIVTEEQSAHRHRFTVREPNAD
jgi:NAD-dependent histone deacetylase SIR2